MPSAVAAVVRAPVQVACRASPISAMLAVGAVRAGDDVPAMCVGCRRCRRRFGAGGFVDGCGTLGFFHGAGPAGVTAAVIAAGTAPVPAAGDAVVGVRVEM